MEEVIGVRLSYCVIELSSSKGSDGVKTESGISGCVLPCDLTAVASRGGPRQLLDLATCTDFDFLYHEGRQCL